MASFFAELIEAEPGDCSVARSQAAAGRLFVVVVVVVALLRLGGL